MCFHKLSIIANLECQSTPNCNWDWEIRESRIDNIKIWDPKANLFSLLNIYKVDFCLEWSVAFIPKSNYRS